MRANFTSFLALCLGERQKYMNVISVQKLLERTKSKQFTFEEDREIIIEFCEKYLASRTLTIEVVDDKLSKVKNDAGNVIGEAYFQQEFEYPSFSKRYGAWFLDQQICGQKDIASVISWMMNKASNNNYIYPSNS